MSTRILIGDCRNVLKTLPDASVHCCVTSPPYFGLRDYGMAGQIGLEPSPDAFVAAMVDVFNEVRRVLRDDGTLWLNLGDSYNAHPGQRKVTDKAGEKQQTNRGAPGAPSRHVPSLKPKDLIGIPWRVAFALQADGWFLRSDIIWAKPNPMPESVTDRPTSSHEHIFLLSKSPRYFYDHEAVREAGIDNPITRARNARSDKGIVGTAALHGTGIGQSGRGGFDRTQESRNLRNVWTVASQPFSGTHFATFPPTLIEPCIKAGCPGGGTVLDPFGGAGTTGMVADRLGRDAILIELNPAYAAMTSNRIEDDAGMFANISNLSTIAEAAP